MYGSRTDALAMYWRSNELGYNTDIKPNFDRFNVPCLGLTYTLLALPTLKARVYIPSPRVIACFTEEKSSILSNGSRPTRVVIIVDV